MSVIAASLAWLAASPAEAQVVGTVLDETSTPVAGARVSEEGAGAGAVVTDASGGFTLPLAGQRRVTVVAAAPGFFHSAARADAPSAGLVLRLAPVPAEDDPAYRLASPSTCGGCHPQQVSEWTGSAMARSGVNTWVYDLYDGTGSAGGGQGFVYERDSLLAAANPESECASCHQPEPWAATPFIGLLPLANAGTAQHGVSCEVCHRVADVDATRVNFPGLYPGVVRMARPRGGEPVMFGLLGDVAYSQPSSMRAALQPQLSALVCAACHQDRNDHDQDGDFEEEGGPISEPTYLEWLASPYADPASPDHATCVDCHMSGTDRTSACNVYVPSTPRAAGQIRSHRIEGTTPAFLENALRLDLAARIEGEEVVVTATLENHATGHHVPTGVTIRNVILLVEARDRDGAPLAFLGDQLVGELGGVGDPAQGYFAGVPGKLYAKVPEDAAGRSPVFFTEAVRLASDDRIPAKGKDVTTYRFGAPAGGGGVTVSARAIYRRAFRALVDTKGWTTDGHGAALADLAAPDFGHRMASAEVTVGEAHRGGGGGGCRLAGEGHGLGAAPALVLVLGWLVHGRSSRRGRTARDAGRRSRR